MEKEFFTVFSATTARKLLKDGYIIADIKPDKLDKDNKRTVFIFKNENNITGKIKEYKEKNLSRETSRSR